MLYKGLETLGGGATLAGIILGAITVFIIDREFEKAAAFALAGTILTFFGFIHGEGHRYRQFADGRRGISRRWPVYCSCLQSMRSSIRCRPRRCTTRRRSSVPPGVLRTAGHTGPP